MRKTALGCTILEGHDIADLPLVSENSEILEREIKRIEQEGGKVKSVNGKIGEVNITKSDVGLSNVDNVKQASKIEFDGHKVDYIHHTGYGVVSGTNAKTITLDPAPNSYVEGMAISFKNTTQNTGEVTINVNGLGVKKILKSNGKELSSGNLQAGSIYTIRYNGSNFILQGEGGDDVILARETNQRLTVTDKLFDTYDKILISEDGSKLVKILGSNAEFYQLTLDNQMTPIKTISNNSLNSHKKCWIMNDGTFYIHTSNNLLYHYRFEHTGYLWIQYSIKLVDIKHNLTDDSLHHIVVADISNKVQAIAKDGSVLWTCTDSAESREPVVNICANRKSPTCHMVTISSDNSPRLKKIGKDGKVSANDRIYLSGDIKLCGTSHDDIVLAYTSSNVRLYKVFATIFSTIKDLTTPNMKDAYVDRLGDTYLLYDGKFEVFYDVVNPYAYCSLTSNLSSSKFTLANPKGSQSDVKVIFNDSNYIHELAYQRR